MGQIVPSHLKKLRTTGKVYDTGTFAMTRETVQNLLIHTAHLKKFLVRIVVRGLVASDL